MHPKIKSPGFSRKFAAFLFTVTVAVALNKSVSAQEKGVQNLSKESSGLKNPSPIQIHGDLNLDLQKFLPRHCFLHFMSQSHPDIFNFRNLPAPLMMLAEEPWIPLPNKYIHCFVGVVVRSSSAHQKRPFQPRYGRSRRPKPEFHLLFLDVTHEDPLEKGKVLEMEYYSNPRAIFVVTYTDSDREGGGGFYLCPSCHGNLANKGQEFKCEPWPMSSCYPQMQNAMITAEKKKPIRLLSLHRKDTSKFLEKRTPAFHLLVTGDPRSGKSGRLKFSIRKETIKYLLAEVNFTIGLSRVASPDARALTNYIAYIGNADAGGFDRRLRTGLWYKTGETKYIYIVKNYLAPQDGVDPVFIFYTPFKITVWLAVISCWILLIIFLAIIIRCLDLDLVEKNVEATTENSSENSSPSLSEIVQPRPRTPRVVRPPSKSTWKIIWSLLFWLGGTLVGQRCKEHPLPLKKSGAGLLSCRLVFVTWLFASLHLHDIYKKLFNGKEFTPEFSLKWPIFVSPYTIHRNYGNIIFSRPDFYCGSQIKSGGKESSDSSSSLSTVMNVSPESEFDYGYPLPREAQAVCRDRVQSAMTEPGTAFMTSREDLPFFERVFRSLMEQNPGLEFISIVPWDYMSSGQHQGWIITDGLERHRPRNQNMRFRALLSFGIYSFWQRVVAMTGGGQKEDREIAADQRPQVPPLKWNDPGVYLTVEGFGGLLSVSGILFILELIVWCISSCCCGGVIKQKQNKKKKKNGHCHRIFLKSRKRKGVFVSMGPHLHLKVV